MEELSRQLQELLSRVKTARDKLGIEAERQALLDMEKDMQSPGFWDDQARAAGISQQAASLGKRIEFWDRLSHELQDALELAKTGDESLTDEVGQAYRRLLQEFEQREFELKLSGPYDANSAIVSIYAGTGGTDAQDWAEMLMRMYLRWAEKQDYPTHLLEISAGEEAGIKSASIEINGQYAYGRLKSEKGVHRLVRLSPFNADNLRQTSFALVEVMPQIEGPAGIDIDPKDLKIDVYRAGGHGGQSVNTTDSAVRITHLPTGLVVAIQNERSQLQNKEKAMQILQSRLQTLMAEQHQEKLSEIKVESGAVQWGSQIRSYVMHPYTMVKDHRTGAETAQVQDVLDGDLDLFTEAYLSSQIGN